MEIGKFIGGSTVSALDLLTWGLTLVPAQRKSVPYMPRFVTLPFDRQAMALCLQCFSVEMQKNGTRLQAGLMPNRLHSRRRDRQRISAASSGEQIPLFALVHAALWGIG